MRYSISVALMLMSALVFADEALLDAGKTVYLQTCIACHGATGKGAIPGVRDLTDPDGALAKPDEELIRNISNGIQSPGSLMAMPAKGGNPALTKDDISAVIAYIRADFAK